MQAEDAKNISPALNDAPKKQMSSKEFQRMLYSWFEEKGLVSDLRSYLRVIMINELRNTNVGGKIEQVKGNFSLSRQAFSLIIAEHLLREGYHYTLSVFSTEVPGVARQLPFSLFEAHTHDESWRFDADCLLNVLELIGIGKNSAESLKIARLYRKNKESLLSCVFNSKVETIVLPNAEGGDYLDQLLAALGVGANVVESVKLKVEEEFRRKLSTERRVDELLAQIDEKNNQIKRLVDELVVHKQGNKRLKQEVQETKRRLNQKVNLKETQLREALEDVAKLQSALEKSSTQDKTCVRQHCTETCQKNIQDNEQLRDAIANLEDDQRVKTAEIEQLNGKIASLLKDLHTSGLNIDFLNSCLLRASQMNLQEDEIPPASSSDEQSENLTAEILKQVRSKLVDLERENDAIDVRLKQLQIK